MKDDKKTTYIATKALEAAVEMAMELDMPLLVTGEPGTGKTQLAYWAAERLGTQVLRFNTKTTSQAKDLFYRYDAIRHFRDAQHKDKATQVHLFDYIKFEALGKAILAGSTQKQVVLVDEIDKAPRDFPNDILFEFEEMAFRVEEASSTDYEAYPFDQKTELRELGLPIAPPNVQEGVIRLPEGSTKPLLILTSNSEKNLPDAFLRRCLFYHIPMPTETEKLVEIVEANWTLSAPYQGSMKAAVELFMKIRGSGLKKPPATAELVKWVYFLEKSGVHLHEDASEQRLEDQLRATYPILAKNKEDLDKLTRGV